MCTISSRKNAKEGYAIITQGNHGSSALGLNDLLNGNKNSSFAKCHIHPVLELNFSKQIAEKIKVDYAMMDSSDGLADALFKMAEASNVKFVIDYSKIPKEKEVSKEQVLFGGEDYKLIAAVPCSFAAQIDGAIVIGKVENYDGIRLDISGQKFENYDDLLVFNHFENNFI